MATSCATRDGFEISPRFRLSLEERIARLEKDAAYDEAQVEFLDDIDHIRRQMRLVAVQRAEALRMRIFLDRATTRPVVRNDKPSDAAGRSATGRNGDRR